MIVISHAKLQIYVWMFIRVEKVEQNKRWSPPFPFCPVSHQYLQKKALIEKNSFVAIDKGLLTAFELTAPLFIILGIFKLEMISEKKIIENTIQFSIFWDIFTFFIQVNFFTFWSFFLKKEELLFSRKI